MNIGMNCLFHSAHRLILFPKFLIQEACWKTWWPPIFIGDGEIYQKCEVQQRSLHIRLPESICNPRLSCVDSPPNSSVGILSKFFGVSGVVCQYGFWSLQCALSRKVYVEHRMPRAQRAPTTCIECCWRHWDLRYRFRVFANCDTHAEGRRWNVQSKSWSQPWCACWSSRKQKRHLTKQRNRDVDMITAGIFGASEIQVTLIEQRGPISWNANWENVEQARDGHSCVRFKLFVCLMDLLMILLRWWVLDFAVSWGTLNCEGDHDCKHA